MKHIAIGRATPAAVPLSPVQFLSIGRFLMCRLVCGVDRSAVWAVAALTCELVTVSLVLLQSLPHHLSFFLPYRSGLLKTELWLKIIKQA